MQQRKISQIAMEIVSFSDQLPFTCGPFLLAMIWLDDPGQKYGFRTARNIVQAFLSAARPWTGQDAERIKTELTELIK